jgi:hypothetical protein
MSNYTYAVQLEGRVLTEGRIRNNGMFNNRNPYEPRQLVQHWMDETTSHWDSFDKLLSSMGPAYTYNNTWELKHAATKAVLAAEAALETRKHLLSHEYTTTGPNYKYNERFETTIDELLELFGRMVNRLQQRARDLELSQGLPASSRDDTCGDSLLGRIQNLMYARHIAILARGAICRIDRLLGVMYYHPALNDWLKISANVERNLAAALIDHAKEFEAFRNERLEEPKK